MSRSNRKPFSLKWVWGTRTLRTSKIMMSTSCDEKLILILSSLEMTFQMKDDHDRRIHFMFKLILYILKLVNYDWLLKFSLSSISCVWFVDSRILDLSFFLIISILIFITYIQQHVLCYSRSLYQWQKKTSPLFLLDCVSACIMSIVNMIIILSFHLKSKSTRVEKRVSLSNWHNILSAEYRMSAIYVENT